MDKFRYHPILFRLAVYSFIVEVSTSSLFKSLAVTKEEDIMPERTEIYDIPHGQFSMNVSHMDITTDFEGSILPNTTYTREKAEQKVATPKTGNPVTKPSSQTNNLFIQMSTDRNHNKAEDGNIKAQGSVQVQKPALSIAGSGFGKETKHIESDIPVQTQAISTEKIIGGSEYFFKESQANHTGNLNGRSIIPFSMAAEDGPSFSYSSSPFSWHEKTERQEEGEMEVEKNEDVEVETDQSGTCSTCGKKDATDEEAKMLRIEMFKQTLIRELRLNPNGLSNSESAGETSRNGVLILPPEMMNQMQQDAPVQDKFYAEDLEIVIPGAYMGPKCTRRQSTGCASFDLKDKIQGGVSEAELWVYKMEDNNDNGKQVMDVYELNKKSGGYLRPTRLVIRREVFVREGWIKMDVTRAVRKWLEEGRDRQRMAFSCTTCKTRNYKALYGVKMDYKPLLVVKFAKRHLRRDERSEHQCNPDHSCCKFPLNVNFFDIGFPKIIAPTNVNIGYCRGSCSRRDQYSTNHTDIVQHLRTYRPTSNTDLMPCCVPTGSLADLRVLEMKNLDAIVTIIHGVIVNQCGCA